MLKPTREKVTELVGSLLGSALAAVMLCLVMVIVESFQEDVLPPVGRYAWMVIVSVLGAWGILIPSKFWEGVKGDSALRRFILMCIGLWVGCVAFLAASTLLVELPYSTHDLMQPYTALPASFYLDDGTPRLTAHAACFGALFLVLRWWRQADPLRATRVSIWSAVICVLFAWLVAQMLLFPQPWLMMVAFVISVSVQLASPWVDTHRRHGRHAA